MSRNFELPKNTIFYKLEKAVKLYRKMAQEHIEAAGYDVNLNQLLLLIQLSDRPESTQIELAELIFKDFASIARTVDLLVEKKYLARKPNAKDKRKKDLILLKSSTEMIAVMKPIILKYRKTALRNFSDRSINQLRKHLDQLTNNCQQNS